MPNYRRAIITGGALFFTVVTFRRRNLFDRAECRAVLRGAVEMVRQKHPFSIDAWVLLSEHMHCIRTLPDGDSDFSKRWSPIKSGFSKQTKTRLHKPESVNLCHDMGDRLNFGKVGNASLLPTLPATGCILTSTRSWATSGTRTFRKRPSNRS